MSVVSSSAVTPGARFTPEDLLSLPEAVEYELVDGKLVERVMGSEASEIAAKIIFLLGVFLHGKGLGRVLGADGSYRCYPDAPDKVRKPDVSFIRSGRLEGDRVLQGHCPIPPDLAVEVLSPGDLAYEIDDKVAEYLAAGVELVWVVNPRTRTVRIHQKGSTTITQLGDPDTISAEPVIPGFSAAVKEFFTAM